MSQLKGHVAKEFAALGLEVENERSGMVVGDGVDGRKLTVRVDENERVVRVEGVLCHPVDDFSPELTRAMDWLNRARAGVCFAYSEAQRALVVSTVWTSPSRDPSPNQLHLLVALLQEACGRDGPQLERVAEGEATWEEVKDGADAAAEEPPAAAGRGTGKRAQRPTGRFSDDVADMEPPTRRFGEPGEDEWPETGDPTTRPLGRGDDDGPRVTTRFMNQADGEDGEFPVDQATQRTTGKRRAPQDLDAAEPPPGADEVTRDEAAPPPAEEPIAPMSRQALAMAVNRVERDSGQRVDLTAGKRGLGYRTFRCLGLLALLAGAGFGVYRYLILPVFPNLARDIVAFVSPDAPQVDVRLQQREQAVGGDLLLLECEDPLEDAEQHKRNVRKALDQLGEKAGATLEGYIIRTPNSDARTRAHAVWAEEGYGKGDVPRMRLLRGLVGVGRQDDKVDRVVPYLLSDLRTTVPADTALIDALGWAKGPVFLAIVELLGRPGEGDGRTGAKARSDALARHLDHDTPEFHVLRAMVRTGFGPPDAAARLLQGRGLEWGRGEGKAMLVEFIVANPDSIGPVLRAENEEMRLAGVDLLVAANTPEAAETLIKGPLRDPALRVRLRTAIGVAQIGHPDSAWPLALALNRRNAEPAFVDEVRRAISRLPATECAAKLGEHLAPALPESDRYFAVMALTYVQNGGGIGALNEAIKDPAVNVRRAAVAALEELQRSEGNRGALSRGLAGYREVARRDADPTMRQAAARLYKALTGHDP